jgi:hypothetical protein
MSNIEQSINELANLLKKNDLLKDDYEEDKLNELINDLKQREEWGIVSPLEMLYLSKIDSTYIDTYDDCNIYQEPHYYENVLRDISQFSDGDIELNNISESWDEEGNVTLSFIENGAQKSLSFNALEEKDIVPDNFVNYIRNTLTSFDGNSKYLSSDGPNGELFFYRLNDAIVEDVNRILESYKNPHI